LEIDLIRKGIQQQDASKISKICFADVEIVGSSRMSRDNLQQQFEMLFANAGQRKTRLPQPEFVRDDCPLDGSHFWDFDILNVQIEIHGDSAFVECVLVLWGGESEPGQPGMGTRAVERFIFYSERARPFQTPDLSENGLFPKSSESYARSWQLVSFEVLYDFLNDTIVQTESENAD